MITNVLTINGHDYTKYIVKKGLSWSSDDLDGPNAGRTLDGIMHRDKITDKINLSYKLIKCPVATLRQLRADLRTQEFTATYDELGERRTASFYCSQLKATLDVIDSDGVEQWGDATFNMHEI